MYIHIHIYIYKFEIAIYTGTRAIAKLNTIQSHLRDVTEDPNLGTFSDWRFLGVWLLINIFHIIQLSTELTFENIYLYTLSF